MSNRTFVVGVGMTPFQKPGTKDGDYPDWASEAAGRALTDAGVGYEQVQQVYVGYCYAESTAGQRSVYPLGLTGVPVINVNNNCSTGSTALYLARQAVRAGVADVVLALGFERMARGSLGITFTDRTYPIDRHIAAMRRQHPPSEAPLAPQMFGNAGIDHMRRYGSTAEHFVKVGWKNHKHSVNNPYAQFRTEYTVDDIANSAPVYGPLTKLQCSPTSDGSAAALVASERFVDRHDLWDRAVEIVGQAMVTDLPGVFDDDTDCIRIVGSGMSQAAARMAYEEAQLGASDVDVVELHDCFSVNEILMYEALGFAPEGHGHKLIETDATTYGGSGPVVNPSGGLISKGHPLGATGLAQCAELSWQVRGLAEARQVDGARVALQHNIGLGGAAVVTVYRAVRA